MNQFCDQQTRAMRVSRKSDGASYTAFSGLNEAHCCSPGPSNQCLETSCRPFSLNASILLFSEKLCQLYQRKRIGHSVQHARSCILRKTFSGQEPDSMAGLTLAIRVSSYVSRLRLGVVMRAHILSSSMIQI